PTKQSSTLQASQSRANNYCVVIFHGVDLCTPLGLERGQSSLAWKLDLKPSFLVKRTILVPNYETSHHFAFSNEQCRIADIGGQIESECSCVSLAGLKWSR